MGHWKRSAIYEAIFYRDIAQSVGCWNKQLATGLVGDGDIDFCWKTVAGIRLCIPTQRIRFVWGVIIGATMAGSIS